MAKTTAAFSQYRRVALSAILAPLVDLARNMAAETPYDGITVADLRQAAERHHLFSGREKGRELSFLGNVMQAAGLMPTDHYRRSTIPQSHGNLHRVWTLK